MGEYVSDLNKLNLADVIQPNKNTRCSWFPEHAVRFSLEEPGDKSVSARAKLPSMPVGLMPSRDSHLILESESLQTRKRTLTGIMESSLCFQQSTSLSVHHCLPKSPAACVEPLVW